MWCGIWWCVQYACLIIIYVIFLEIIDNKKLEQSDEVDDDVYILHVKRYTIISRLGS
jgi:hypothetical protein